MSDEFEHEQVQNQPNLDENTKIILDYIVKNGPYGEISDILADLKILVSDYPAYEQHIENLLMKHAQDHFAICKDHPHQSSFLLTKMNYMESEGYYLDQTNNLKVFVDHKTLRVIRTEEIEIGSNPVLSQYRNQIEKGIQEYLKDYYQGTDSGYLVYLDWDEDNFTIYIAITCKNLKLQSYHGGEWISDWKIDAQFLEGKIRVNSHFFEDGNVCLKDIKNYKDNVKFSGQEIENESKQIVKQIIAAEQNVQTSLESIYDRMSDTFFKNMRRILPVTNQKMNWDQTVHKLIANLKK